MDFKPLEIKIVHTPARKEVFFVDEVREVERQRGEAFEILEDLYNSRGELDKLNCKIVRLREFLKEDDHES